MVDSLQDTCIFFMKSSKFSANYALAVEPGYIARKIFISEADDVPVIFIHTRCTIVDGNFQRGVACGFHVSRKSFLLGVFEGCVCQKPRNLVQWHSEIKIKDVVQVITKTKLSSYMETVETDMTHHLCEPTSWTSMQTSYLYQHVARWIVKHRHWLAIELNQEFLRIAKDKIEPLPRLALPGYI